MRILLAALLLALTTASNLAAQQKDTGGGRLAGVRSWGYQLQKIEPAEIAASPFDLVVIDYSRTGTDKGRFTRDEVKAMQVKPDGKRRLVLAYMSVGEAEDYRFYWQKGWVEPAPYRGDLGQQGQAASGTLKAAGIKTVRIPRLTAPGWLGRENEVWGGNYQVRFWYDGWQNLIMHHDGSYLSRIQEAGFDGAYLDRVDAYYAIEGDREDAARRMVDFIVEFAQIARSRRPGFLIVPQNAEELLAVPRYVTAIDAVAREDLLLAAGSGQPNPAERIDTASALLKHALDAGRPVLAVEYTEDIARKQTLERDLRARGTIPYFAPRKLDRIVPPS